MGGAQGPEQGRCAGRLALRDSVVRAVLTATAGDRISASFCFFDDAIVVAGPMGTVVRNKPRVQHGQLEFSFEDDHWEIARYAVTSETVLAPGARNSCTAEALVQPG